MPSSGARIGVDEAASSDTTLRLSYDNIMLLRVNRPSTRRCNRRSGATSYRATQTRQRRCALPMMMPSIFGAEKCISEPPSALAVLTGRHRGKNTRDQIFSQKSTSQRYMGSLVY